jgi:hypothetical protein
MKLLKGETTLYFDDGSTITFETSIVSVPTNIKKFIERKLS